MILSKDYPLQTLPDVVIDRDLWGSVVLYTAKKEQFDMINMSSECTFRKAFH